VRYTPERAAALKAETFDLASMRQTGYAYERLDQLTMEILLGVR
jgi:xylose isomerase